MGMRHYELDWETRQAFADTILELLFADIADHFGRGEYGKVDDFLRVAQVENTEHAVLCGVLQITQAHANLLPSRSSFYHRVYEEVRRTRSEKEARSLLARYERWIPTRP